MWDAGPVGQFAVASAYLLGAERVIAIDRFPYRLEMASDKAGAETINDEEVDVREALRDLTAGLGPARASTPWAWRLTTGRGPFTLTTRRSRRRGSRPSAPCPATGDHELSQWRNGVGHGRLRRHDRQVPHGLGDEPVAHHQDGAVPRTALHAPLLERVQSGEIDPSFVITHHMPRSEAGAATTCSRASGTTA